MSELGLTCVFPLHGRCDQCDIILTSSEYKDQKIVFSISTKTNKGFTCLKCATRENQKGTNKKRKKVVTIQDLDDFINKLLGVKHGN